MDSNRFWLALIGAYDLLLGGLFVFGALFLLSRIDQHPDRAYYLLCGGFIFFGVSVACVGIGILQRTRWGQRYHSWVVWIAIPALMALAYDISEPLGLKLHLFSPDKQGLPEGVAFNLGLVSLIFAVGSSLYITKSNVKVLFDETKRIDRLPRG